MVAKKGFDQFSFLLFLANIFLSPLPKGARGSWCQKVVWLIFSPFQPFLTDFFGTTIFGPPPPFGMMTNMPNMLNMAKYAILAHIWAGQIWSSGVSLKNLAKCSSAALFLGL